MGRQLRPSLPGVPFHLTARTQWQEPLFSGLEGEVAALVRASTDSSDVRLLAYAVMANHLHVIVVQGRQPLSKYMQPLLRRIALMVMRRRQRSGHIFGGRYRHSACQDPEYFRSMIAYVHLNPVRAGLCADPDAYAWTSHSEYAVGPAAGCVSARELVIEQGLRIFAAASGQTTDACRRDYRSFIRWRQLMDQHLENGSEEGTRRAPLATGGDLHWQQQFGTCSSLRVARVAEAPQRIQDLRDMALRALESIAPDVPLYLLRSGGRSRDLAYVRKHVIARGLAAGHPTTKLAAFLNVSPSTVTRVGATLRAIRS